MTLIYKYAGVEKFIRSSFCLLMRELLFKKKGQTRSSAAHSAVIPFVTVIPFVAVIPFVTVIPAKAGIHSSFQVWTPAFAGVTRVMTIVRKETIIASKKMENLTCKSGCLNILKRFINVLINRLCKNMRFCISMSWIDKAFFLPTENLFFKKIGVCTFES